MEIKMITVNEIMSTELITLEPGDSVSKAAETMTKNNIRHIPIVGHQNQVLGIISQRDVLKAGALSDQINTPALDVPISEIMTKGILTTHPKDSLRAAGLTLQKHKYGCLPVVDNAALVGIITDSDFVGVAINLIEEQDSNEDLEAG
jgi:CBS domain-containing protein